MHIDKIRWKNFLSTGNSWIELDFNSPTTLIIGKNGHGKSTVLDAICYALFNKSFRRINKPQLVNSINKKNCLVEIFFTNKGVSYMVRRGQEPEIFEIYANDQLLPQSSKSKDYQNYLERNILRMNFKTFIQISILGSSNYIPFMQLTPDVRREIIEDLLDLQIFSKMNLVVKNKIASSKLALSEIDLKIVEKQLEVSSAEKLLEQVKESTLEAIEGKKSTIEDSKNKIKILTKSFEKLAKTLVDFDNKKKEYQQLSAKIKEKEKTMEKANQKKKEHASSVQFYDHNKNCPTCSQDIPDEFVAEMKQDLNSKIEKIEKVTKTAKESLEVDNKKLDELKKELLELQEKSKEKSSIEIKIKAEEQFINSLNEEIERFKKKRENDTSYEDMITTATKNLEFVTSQKETLVNQRYLLDVAYSLLKDGGIKTRIIKKYIPIVNALINKYLASLDFFVNFELNEKFEEKILSRHRDEFSYSNFSEGEKSRLDIAILFAWRAIAKMKNSVSTNLLILDEVFDGSLDAEGTRNLLELICNMEKDSNIVVISHNTEAMIDRFDKILHFTKTKNFSEVSQVTGDLYE